MLFICAFDRPIALMQHEFDSIKGKRIPIPKGEEKRFLDNFVGECFSPCPGFDSDVVFEIFLLVPSIELIFMYSSSAA